MAAENEEKLNTTSEVSTDEISSENTGTSANELIGSNEFQGVLQKNRLLL